MRMIFHYIGNDAKAFKTGYQEVIRSEYYHGAIGPIEAQDGIDLFMTRLMIEGVGILCQRSNTQVIFRRSSKDLADGADVFLIWMVLEGSVIVRRDRRTFVAEAGSCLVLRSDRPFFAVGKGASSNHISVQIVVPAILVESLGLKPRNLDLIQTLDRSGDTAIRRLFSTICERFGSYVYVPSPSLFSELMSFVQSAFAEISYAEGPSTWERVHNEFQRLMYNPDLSAQLLANVCGLSRRQIFYLFKINGTSFSDALWRGRLAKAYELITAEEETKPSIDKISRLTGFKHSCHFSRMFKRHYGIAPSNALKRPCRTSQLSVR